MIPFFLASASPRRQELMNLLINDFQIVNPDYRETNLSEENPYDVVCRNTIGKNISVSSHILPVSYCVLSSDTVVVWRNQVIGKPINQEEATQFLRHLRGDHHDVITGISIRIQEKENYVHRYFTETTRVEFHHFHDEAILSYVRESNPIDKAGGYGIQEIPSDWVQSVKGEFENVIGLPVQRLKAELSWLSQYFDLPIYSSG